MQSSTNLITANYPNRITIDEPFLLFQFLLLQPMYPLMVLMVLPLPNLVDQYFLVVHGIGNRKAQILQGAMKWLIEYLSIILLMFSLSLPCIGGIRDQNNLGRLVLIHHAQMQH